MNDDFNIVFLCIVEGTQSTDSRTIQQGSTDGDTLEEGLSMSIIVEVAHNV